MIEWHCIIMRRFTIAITLLLLGVAGCGIVSNEEILRIISSDKVLDSVLIRTNAGANSPPF